MAAIGYVAALLLVKIEKAFVRSEVGSSIKVEDRPDSARSGRVLVVVLIAREGAAAR